MNDEELQKVHKQSTRVSHTMTVAELLEVLQRIVDNGGGSFPVYLDDAQYCNGVLVDIESYTHHHTGAITPTVILGY